MFYRYGFESEVYPGLSRIPLYVRLKLDRTGVRLSLKTWLAFSMEERSALCHLPVESEEEKRNYSSYLVFLVIKYTGDTPKREQAEDRFPWDDVGEVPEPVRLRCEQAGKNLEDVGWSRLNVYERYALYKLAVSKNEPEKFNEALLEFCEKGSGSS